MNLLEIPIAFVESTDLVMRLASQFLQQPNNAINNVLEIFGYSVHILAHAQEEEPLSAMGHVSELGKLLGRKRQLVLVLDDYA